MKTKMYSMYTDEELVCAARDSDALFGEVALRTLDAVREIRDWIREQQVAKRADTHPSKPAF